jgi:hypothetical protein
MVCPDFCFEVYCYDEPVLHEAAAASEVPGCAN